MLWWSSCLIELEYFSTSLSVTTKSSIQWVCKPSWHVAITIIDIAVNKRQAKGAWEMLPHCGFVIESKENIVLIIGHQRIAQIYSWVTWDQEITDLRNQIPGLVRCHSIGETSNKKGAVPCVNNKLTCCYSCWSNAFDIEYMQKPGEWPASAFVKEAIQIK